MLVKEVIVPLNDCGPETIDTESDSEIPGASPGARPVNLTVPVYPLRGTGEITPLKLIDCPAAMLTGLNALIVKSGVIFGITLTHAVAHCS